MAGCGPRARIKACSLPPQTIHGALPAALLPAPPPRQGIEADLRAEFSKLKKFPPGRPPGYLSPVPKGKKRRPTPELDTEDEEGEEEVEDADEGAWGRGWG